MLSRKKWLLVGSIALLLFLILVAVVIVVRNRNRKSPDASALPTTLVNVRSGQHTLALSQDDKLRSYIVHIPTGYNKSSKYPLVFSLHGGGSNAKEQIGLNDLNDVADKEGFIVVYPNAIGNNWNDGRAHTAEKSSNANDIGFIKLIIEKLGQWVSIDSYKIYSTGISNGGMMSIRLACDAAETFAAIAPVASSMPEELKPNCAPTKPISVLEIQGTADPLVPYNGGEIKGIAGRSTADRGVLLSANDSFSFWTSFDKCSSPAKEIKLIDTDPNDGTSSTESLYETCTANTQVGLITVTGGGHTWPGGKQYLGERLVGKVSKDISASQVIWDFFKTKSR